MSFLNEIPADLTALGPTAGVLIVVWAFLRYLSQQREAADKESHEEREAFRAESAKNREAFSKAVSEISAAHERTMERVSSRVEGLADVHTKLTDEIRKLITKATA